MNHLHSDSATVNNCEYEYINIMLCCIIGQLQYISHNKHMIFLIKCVQVIMFLNKIYIIVQDTFLLYNILFCDFLL